VLARLVSVALVTWLCVSAPTSWTAGTDAVHVEGLGSGHEMHATARDLVQQAVEAVVAAVRAGKPLGPCRRLFSATTERCLS
jgi:hypothetical protein